MRATGTSAEVSQRRADVAPLTLVELGGVAGRGPHVTSVQAQP